MKKDEEEALFEKRVKKINRDCFMTFFPFISAIGIAVIGLIVYFYQEQREDTKSLLNMTTISFTNIKEIQVKQELQGKDIDALNNKVFGK